MSVVRFVGLVLMLLATAVVGFDLVRLIAESGPTGLLTAGELWYRLHPGSLNLAQAVIQRHVAPVLWDPVVVTVLLWPAVLVLGATGLLLWFLGGRGRRY